MKNPKTIEDLFRKEFDSFEVQPSGKVWKDLRFELFRRNFFHFSPWSVNVWYIGGVLVVSSLLVVGLGVREGHEDAKDDISFISLPASDSLYDSVPTADESQNNNSLSQAGNAKNFGQSANTGTRKSHESVRQNPHGKPGNQQNATNTQETSEEAKQAAHTVFGEQQVMAWFRCNDAEGCVPLSSSFVNLSQNAVRYFWSFGDGGSSDQANPSYIFDEAGTWFVSLTAFSANNDISIFTDSIKVYSRPEARFSMDSNGKPGEGSPVYFYNYSRGAESYLWDFGDGSTSNLREPDHFFNTTSPARILLKAVSAEGCTDSTVLLDAFKTGEPKLLFPTAFSPNRFGPGDGRYSENSPDNDIFHPVVSEEPEEYQLKIFNRKGVLLFESNDIAVGWDGYYRQELQPQEVYVWKARARFADGQSVVKMGDVTVVW